MIWLCHGCVTNSCSSGRDTKWLSQWICTVCADSVAECCVVVHGIVLSMHAVLHGGQLEGAVGNAGGCGVHLCPSMLDPPKAALLGSMAPIFGKFSVSVLLDLDPDTSCRLMTGHAPGPHSKTNSNSHLAASFVSGGIEREPNFRQQHNPLHLTALRSTRKGKMGKNKNTQRHADTVPCHKKAECHIYGLPQQGDMVHHSARLIIKGMQCTRAHRCF